MHKREIWIYLILWLGLIVLWNYGYPPASPLEDVLAAIVILIITRFTINKKFTF